jgi:hypothetical protein
MQFISDLVTCYLERSCFIAFISSVIRAVDLIFILSLINKAASGESPEVNCLRERESAYLETFNRQRRKETEAHLARCEVASAAC